MCIGLFALFDPIKVPDFLPIGIYVILGAAAIHFISIALLGRLPRSMGWVLIGAYALFLYQGLVH
jgi:cation:H+ antiporter